MSEEKNKIMIIMQNSKPLTEQGWMTENLQVQLYFATINLVMSLCRTNFEEFFSAIVLWCYFNLFSFIYIHFSPYWFFGKKGVCV